MKFFLLVLYFFEFINSFNVAVVGGGGDLGKELLYQGLVERKLKMLAFTQSNKILIPYRGNTFNNVLSTPQLKNQNLQIENYWQDIKNFKYDHLIFCTSARPFGEDYSDELTVKFLNNLPLNCKSISLVSAYGVGDSLNGANIGIQVMNSLYLKDVYRAKNVQEQLLNNSNLNIEKFIYRPKALSYGKTNIDSTSRKDLAKKILDDLNL